MRGEDRQAGGLFSYVDLEARVPADHPLRPIRRIVDDGRIHELDGVVQGDAALATELAVGAVLERLALRTRDGSAQPSSSSVSHWRWRS